MRPASSLSWLEIRQAQDPEVEGFLGREVFGRGGGEIIR